MTTDGTPRTARTGDLPGLQRLAEDFYREDGFTTPPDVLAVNLGQLIGSAQAHVVVIADDGGSLTGFAITTTGFGLENGLVAELEDLYIVPGARRKGLATGLIDDAAAWARARGCTKLEIVIAPNGRDVSHLHAYYQARGFVDDGRRIVSRDLG